MKKSFKILKDITGISCPFFGVSWNPSETDRHKIRKLLTYLEDRRVLFNPRHLEVPSWVSESIIDIRTKLSDLIAEFDEDSEVVEILRTMRSSCRRYLDRTFKFQRERFMSDILVQNILELRSVFGICIAKLSVMYGINIEEALAEIIPLINDEDNKRYVIDKKTFLLKNK